MKPTDDLKTKVEIVAAVADTEAYIEFLINYHRGIGIFHAVFYRLPM